MLSHKNHQFLKLNNIHIQQNDANETVESFPQLMRFQLSPLLGILVNKKNVHDFMSF